MASDLEVVVQASKTLEKLLEDRYAATGRGLHEKISSVENHLDAALVGNLRFIATLRNKLVHESETSQLEDRDRFEQVLAEAIEDLSPPKIPVAEATVAPPPRQPASERPQQPKPPKPWWWQKAPYLRTKEEKNAPAIALLVAAIVFLISAPGLPFVGCLGLTAIAYFSALAFAPQVAATGYVLFGLMLLGAAVGGLALIHEWINGGTP